MAFYFNLHRFGLDEFAVGHLINGDLPTDDEERWNILSAPRFRIQKLLAEHQGAQSQLRECRDSGKPFVLFLRSFSSEQWSSRIDSTVVSNFTRDSSEFLSSLTLNLAQEGIQIVRLHGGSDAFFPDPDVVGAGNILSTNAENWEAVATELILAASAIVLLIGELTPGVAREVQLIRHHARVDETLTRIVDLGGAPGPENRDLEGLRGSLADFREMDWQTLADVLRDARTHASLERAIDAEFSYLEPSFVESEDFGATERRIWTTMINLRVLFEDTYWAALKRHGVAFEHLDFSRAWVGAHQVYGLAVATADFRGIAEALSYLYLLYIRRGADFALVIPHLAEQFKELGEQMYPDGAPDMEARFAARLDPLKLAATRAVALKLCELAADDSRNADGGRAAFFYQAATICALRAADEDDLPRNAMVSGIASDWAQLQTRTGDDSWALVNYRLALALRRELAAGEPARYAPEVTFCLNNIGSLRFRQGDLQEAGRCFEESLAIRREYPSETDPLKELYISLLNLGMVRVELGDYTSGRALYSEGLRVCEQRSDPDAPVDLTRQEGYMSLCLANIPGAEGQAREYARRAAERLPHLNPAAAAELRPLVDAAVAGLS